MTRFVHCAMPALTFALGLSGCALASAVPPSVAVTDVRLTGLGLTQQRLALTLCVSNPNTTALNFRRVTADVDVAGAPLATGGSDLAVLLPPHASTIVPFTVATTTENLGTQLVGVLRSGAIDYRVHGTVVLQGLLGLTLPYSRSGRLDPLAGGLDLADAAASTAPSACADRPAGPSGA